MDRKYFFFDIDGTLLVGEPGRQYVPDSAKETLKKLEESGHFVAIATGRSYAMSVDVMRSFGLKNMVSDGGNGITIDGKLIEIKPLDRDACIALIDECREKGFAWGFSPDDAKRRLIPDERFINETHDVYMESVIVDGLDPRDYDEFYKVYVACYSPDEEKLESLSRLPWCRYHDEYFFVEPIDKSVGIERMMQELGAPLKDVVVFGDGLNDMTMFRNQWISIAMGNADDAIKEKASYVTTDAADDGIYNACSHFGWI